jgi:hypothetical protein
MRALPKSRRKKAFATLIAFYGQAQRASGVRTSRDAPRLILIEEQTNFLRMSSTLWLKKRSSNIKPRSTNLLSKRPSTILLALEILTD